MRVSTSLEKSSPDDFFDISPSLPAAKSVVLAGGA
jgi:hypothetical protein